MATLDPLIAAKTAHPAILVCNKPPGTAATSFARPRYMRLLSPLACRISAIRMNSGIAVSVKLSMLPQLTRPSPFSATRPPWSRR